MGTHTESLELPAQQKTIRARCFHPSNTYIRFEIDEIEQSISNRFEKQVEKYPGRIAIKTKDKVVSFNELNKIANKLARAILIKIGDRDDRVALFLNDDVSIVTGILSVWKSAKTCVTIDPFFPKTRLKHMLEDAQVKLIITDDKNSSLVEKLNRERREILNIEGLQEELSDKNLDLSIQAESTAYIMYTSGSTGEPKGIVHSHRSLLHNVMNYTNAFHICLEDKLTLLHSYSFNSAMVDIFCAILNGATLFPWHVFQDGFTDLPNWLIVEGITIFSWSPTPFRQLLDSLSDNFRFESIRVLTLGGESVSRKDFELYKIFFPDDCILVNRLGTTETNNFRIYFFDKDISMSWNSLPVGYEVPDKQVLILNEQGIEVEIGQEGEIAVKSKHLALGYWRKPRLSQSVFLPDPDDEDSQIYLTGDKGVMHSDGCLEYLGRKDTQIKIRGYRIEVSEIEMALIRLNQVKDAAVIAQEDEVGEKWLAAYFIPAVESSPSSGDLFDALSQTLPKHMVPSVFIRIEDFPLTPSGKLDRKAFPIPHKRITLLESNITKPKTQNEKVLEEIWCEVLELERVGIHDNFFEIGGNSLIATRLFTRIYNEFDKKLAPSTIFKLPTIEQLANILEKEIYSNTHTSLVRLQRGQSRRPSLYCLPGNLGNVYTDLGYLSKHLGQDQPVYGLQDGLGQPSNVKALAELYVQEIRSIQPEGPYYLGGICSGGVVVFEMAQQLMNQGEEIALLAIVEPGSLPLPGARTYIDLFSEIWERFTRKISISSSDVHSLSFSEMTMYIRLRLKLIRNLWSQKHYKLKRYPGGFHLFLTDDSLTNSHKLRWSEFANDRVEVHQIPGTHRSITGDNTDITESEMQALAKQLRELIIDFKVES